MEVKDDYCQCGKEVPILWEHTCCGCGKRYLFPQGRPHGVNPLPDGECVNLLVAIFERDSKASYRGLETNEWNEVFCRLLDAEYLSIYKGFFVMGAGIFCNPRLSGMSPLYFTTKDGAFLWKRLKYKNALYDVDICQKLMK